MDIKRLRVECGLQQKQVAYSLGVTQAIVSAWQLGKRVPNSENIVKLAKLFGCSVEQLMNSDELPLNDMQQIIEPPQTKKADDTVIDSALVSLLTELSDQERQAVFAFVAGLKANRRE